MVRRSHVVDDARGRNEAALRALIYSCKGWQMAAKGASGPTAWIGPQNGHPGQLIPINGVSAIDTVQTPRPAGVLVPRNSEQWEMHKQVIEDLYLRQNKRLQDVMAIMAEEYQFRATSVPPETGLPSVMDGRLLNVSVQQESHV